MGAGGTARVTTPLAPGGTSTGCISAVRSVTSLSVMSLLWTVVVMLHPPVSVGSFKAPPGRAGPNLARTGGTFSGPYSGAVVSPSPVGSASPAAGSSAS